ncbi:MAG: hypothetical protein WCZ72_01800 [Gemmobacter sp.]
MIQAVAIALGIAGFSTAAMACPDYRQSGETYHLSGTDLYAPHSFDVIAGGNHSIERCHIPLQTDRGDGYVAQTPDFTFSLSRMGSYRLEISARSDCDTVLLVNTSQANWYYDDDDGGDLDPKITLTRPSDGWLDVWVGTYGPSTCRATLQMETFHR